MTNNTGYLKQAFEKRGLTVNQIVKIGFNYDSVWKHFRGDRAVSPEMAIEYEKKLGIPRYELRPDLWSMPEKESE